MKKICIEGLNGTLTIEEKYLLLIIYGKRKNSKQKKYIGYDEIKEITYTKPTRDKYGNITLLVLNQNNKEVKYILILDKVLSIFLDQYKLVYETIKKEVNKKKKTHEVTVEDKEEDESIIEIQIEENIDLIKENLEIKEEKKAGTNLDNSSEPKIVLQKNTTVKEKENNNKKKKDKEKGKDKEELDTNENSNESENTTDSDKDKISELLFKKLANTKSELKKLYYQYYVLNNYADHTIQLEEIEKLLTEIQKLIDELEKIKKAIKLNDKKDKFKLDEDEKTLDPDNLYKYIKIYKDIAEEISNVEEETNNLNDEVTEKRDKIKLSDEQFEKDLNLIYGIKDNNEFLKKYINEVNDKIKKINILVKQTTENGEHTRLVLGQVTAQTRRLMNLAALTMARPGLSRFIGTAFMLNAGTRAIRNMLSFDTITEYYTDYITTSSVNIPEKIDFSDIDKLLSSSKKDIEDILSHRDDYKDHPEFHDLEIKLNEVKEIIENEEKELARVKDIYYKFENQKDKTTVTRVETGSVRTTNNENEDENEDENEYENENRRHRRR